MLSGTKFGSLFIWQQIRHNMFVRINFSGACCPAAAGLLSTSMNVFWFDVVFTCIGRWVVLDYRLLSKVPCGLPQFECSFLNRYVKRPTLLTNCAIAALLAPYAHFSWHPAAAP